MMDNPEYARAAIRKIESYEKNGIYPGENLILTFETQQNVLDFKIIEEMINRYINKQGTFKAPCQPIVQHLAEARSFRPIDRALDNFSGKYPKYLPVISERTG